MNILMTGGSRSGKSSAAASLVAQRLVSGENCLDIGRALVITFGKRGVDSEFDDRIARHVKDRPPTWETLELGDAPVSQWAGAIDTATTLGVDVIMVDCVGTLMGCVLDECATDLWGDAFYDLAVLPTDLELKVCERCNQALDVILASNSDVVVVTNEVGMSLTPAHSSGRLFSDALGHVNQHLSASCDKTYFVIAGKCVDLAVFSAPPSWK